MFSVQKSGKSYLPGKGFLGVRNLCPGRVSVNNSLLGKVFIGREISSRYRFLLRVFQIVKV
jgi:hypothetical protein